MKITGQLITREIGADTRDGRKLFILCGVVAAPADALKGETQYTVGGELIEDYGGLIPANLMLVVHGDSARDVHHLTQGDSPSGWLRKPMWRY